MTDILNLEEKEILDVDVEETVEVLESEVIIIPFEEKYEEVKNNPNGIWFFYEEKIKKIINGIYDATLNSNIY